ncbi:glutathione S-transferase family protein [Croceicoccus marinus]|jgi:glutathione S-transferase|uniref:Glutathione S-transferase family protein n=1 Tax=Croceicoccus marinus TaxID=450378 RepID=A0A7G6VWU1_9SPHN|nr:glutathione S-transferase family protein [Croceicoccus marinus]QNE06206.1 glutathione S-transferase family protein [Croceicoccus marinus]
MLTVHHLRTSQSERIVWLCEELGIDYDLKLYDRRSDNRMAPDQYKALHPMGIAPVITEGDLVLGESAAICDYINARHGGGRLAPSKDSADFADHLFWFHFANGSMMPISYIELSAPMMGADSVPAFISDRKARAWSMIEQRLSDAPFFGGEALTTADIMMIWSLTTGRAFRQFSLDDYPATRAYLQRIGERPAYRSAREKAEPGVEPMLS